MTGSGPGFILRLLIVVLIVVVVIVIINIRKKRGSGGKARTQTRGNAVPRNASSAGTCPKCGAELDPGARFCAFCGAKVE